MFVLTNTFLGFLLSFITFFALLEVFYSFTNFFSDCGQFLLFFGSRVLAVDCCFVSVLSAVAGLIIQLPGSGACLLPRSAAAFWKLYWIVGSSIRGVFAQLYIPWGLAIQLCDLLLLLHPGA